MKNQNAVCRFNSQFGPCYCSDCTETSSQLRLDGSGLVRVVRTMRTRSIHSYVWSVIYKAGSRLHGVGQ